MKFIIDIHLDLSMNAIEWNRDLTQSVLQINTQEKDLIDKPDRGKATVSLQAMREGNIGFCVATQIARYVKSKNPLPGWNSPAQAWAQTQGQLAWYKAMERAGEMVQIIDKKGLQSHLDLWSSSELNKPIGYLLNLEGADSIVTFDHLHRAYEQGLRAIGPAHYGPGTYAYGTDSEGGLGTKGKELLNEIEKLNMILDVTHLCDQSFWEAIDHYNGKMWASHSNCRSLVPNQRQFSNLQIKELIARKAIIGMATDFNVGVETKGFNGFPFFLKCFSGDETGGFNCIVRKHVCELMSDRCFCLIGMLLVARFQALMMNIAG